MNGSGRAQIDPGTVVDDAVAIAEIPAPSGGEAARATWLQRRLANAPGLLWQDEVGNLVWAHGDPPYRLGLLTHLDTVFEESTDHRVTRRDGWLHGPGIGDNSVALAVTVAVVEALSEAFDGSLAVVFTVGEEGLGGLRGAKHACATLPLQQVVALEGHGLDTVYVNAVGSVRTSLTATGPGGHSWWDRGRPSATHELVRVLHTLLAGPPPNAAINVGTLTGGTSVNAIAAHAQALVEARSLDPQGLAGFEEWLASVPDRTGGAVGVRVLDRRPPGRLAPDHPLYVAVAEARRDLGLPDAAGDGSTDANAALGAGIPALSLGCARGADMHSPTERIEVASIRPGVDQLQLVLLNLLADTDTDPGAGAPAEEATP